MRKFKLMFLLCSFCLISISASANDFSAKNADGVTIYYSITSSTKLTCGVRSSKSALYSGTVNIPASVKNGNDGKTYSVTSIDGGPIGGAFYNCTGLYYIIIPNSVTSIGEHAFENCSGLQSIEIPNSVTSIGSYAFEGCSGLTSIVVESGNVKYDSRNNCNAIIETATNTLLTGCRNTIIPNSVTSIGEYAFYQCRGLKSIKIPNSVTNIGDWAFTNCTDLTSVTIPNSVTSIGWRAFNCGNLEHVYVYWTKPISINKEIFDVNISGYILITLWVPIGKANFYRADYAWGKFVEIKEHETPEDVSCYIAINGLEGGEIMQKVDIGMTYSYKFKPYEEWEINSVTFNGVDVTSQLQDSIFSTPAIAGNSALSVVYKKVSSAIDAVEGNDDVRILATSGAIVINGAKAGKAVSVYGLNGNMVESTKTNGASTIVSLPQKGVYIVKVGNDVFKVSI